jgi:choline dehydrogenase-like flavoprotein
MIEDINNLENNTKISADICIIGAGAAGITLALELDKTDKKVILLEAGGFDFPTKEEGFDIYSGQSTGRDYDIQNSRLRYFGGTTNHWGGWCRPLDAIDFHDNDSGKLKWPITHTELMPYYANAAKICELENYQDYEKLNQSNDNSILNLEKSQHLTNKYFIFSPPTRFGSRYRDDVKQSKNVHCFLYANATELIIEDAIAKGVLIKSLAGKDFKVKSKKIIVALGGMENTRFLLLNSQANKKKIPNKNQLIGQYFMDHPGISPGKYLFKNDLKYYRHLSSKGVVMPFISLRDKTILDNKLMNLAIFLNPQEQNETLQNDYLENPFFHINHHGSNYYYKAILEPTPYIKSTISLSDEHDELQQRKLKLNWQIDPNDYIKAQIAFELIAKELALLGLGRAKFNENYIAGAKKAMGYGMHHMGTTRMGQSASTSVTDSYGELHEIQNLFVAGSSLFPTVGFSNPTLTITALCIRLADKLKRKNP